MHRIALMLLLGLVPALCAGQMRVDVWSYQVSPPFAAGDAPGLSASLTSLLNTHPSNQNRFYFKLTQLPRKRLDLLLAENRPGIVLWAAPEFFSPLQMENSNWSDALLNDRQEFVSLQARPHEYKGPRSLYGLTLGTVLGHRYRALEPSIVSGRIKGENVRSDLQNLHKLRSGRVDAILIPRSTLLHYHAGKVPDDLYISSEPLYQFARHIMFTGTLNKTVLDYLAGFIEALPRNAQWRESLKRHGLEAIEATSASRKTQ